MYFIIYFIVIFLQTWTPHYFVLTSKKIYYSEETSRYQSSDEEDNEGRAVKDYNDDRRGDFILTIRNSALRCYRSATTTSSTAPSTGSTGSWVAGGMGGRWRRSSCRSTAKAAGRKAPSWCGRVRRLLETTPSPSGPWVLALEYFSFQILDK